jgi:hypothetical protein
MNIKATKKPKYINITGAKDPRGPDNTIKIWLDESGRLVIQVDKPVLRRYPFSHVNDTPAFIQVIQNK